MTDNNIAIAEAFYNAFNNNDLSSIEQKLHPEVQYVAPMGELSGRDAVLVAAKRLLNTMKSIKIRARFSSGDQVMLVYDLYYGESGTVCPTAVLMNFKDGLIVRNELFYDARPFGNL